MATDYKARAKTLWQVTGSGNEAMETVILDMIQFGIPESEAKDLIYDIGIDLFGYDGFDFLNRYRELKLRAGGSTGATVLPEDFPDPMNIKQFAAYTGRSVQWCYNHTHSLPKTQDGNGKAMVFYRKNVDKWLEERQNKRAE